jgi:predicted pyridoxine 5'-phosphate oxidase superfamily flavin-nucleotide-binding protein
LADRDLRHIRFTNLRRHAVAVLTEDMKRLVREQGFGFFATVNSDGSPNLSPKGTTLVWDDEHLGSEPGSDLVREAPTRLG